MSDQTQLGIFLLFMMCLLPLILTALAAYFILRFGRKQIENMAGTDSDKLMAQFLARRDANPNEHPEVIIQQMINQQAFRCGVVGALTSLGGFITLPIALPVDLVLSTQIQSALVLFIARAYGQERGVDNRVASWLLMSAGGRAAQSGSQLGLRLIVRFLGKTFSKFVPVFGAIIGFIINYMIAQSSARLAHSWYSQKVNQQSA